MAVAAEVIDEADLFRSIVMESPIPIALLASRQFIITVANEAQLAVWGKGDQVFGLPLARAIPEMEGQPFLTILENVFDTGTTFSTDNMPARMVIDGVEKTVFFDFSFKAVRNAQGAIYGILATGIDITRQKADQQALASSEERYRQLAADLDQQVRSRTQQLEESVRDLKRSNENLQQFAFIASHDLQEPLRKVQQFGDLLKNEHGPRLGSGLTYIERMQSAASRMSTLISDLLTFSRISTQRDSVTPVPLGNLLTMIVANLELSVEEAGAVVEMGELPTIIGNPFQLEQLFQNLLGNALKFRRPDVTPHIEIRASQLTADQLPVSIKPDQIGMAYCRIDIRDNGIGFDEKYLDRIFGVFQRLHGRSEFAGTGIGLAICEKVVANHGGMISAQSQPGQGSTFSVFLPDVH